MTSFKDLPIGNRFRWPGDTAIYIKLSPRTFRSVMTINTIKLSITTRQVEPLTRDESRKLK